MDSKYWDSMAETYSHRLIGARRSRISRAVWMRRLPGTGWSSRNGLKAWKGIGKSKDWDGQYRDGYGGRLAMVRRGAKLHFVLEVVRGPTHHTGSITGVAEVNGAMARFAGEAPGDERPTWLSFLKNRNGDGRVEIIGENTQPFHGARAYFDGHYLRVAELSPQEKEEVEAEADGGEGEKSDDAPAPEGGGQGLR